jgi:putative ABC transport system ATP-binding protein
MLELNQKTSTTFVFSTHDKMVMDFARRIIRLRDGKIESDQKVNTQ